MALILHLDENNTNSWNGEPTTNFMNSDGMDMSVISGYAGTTETRITENEALSDYACEMEITTAAGMNNSNRHRFGGSSGMPTSGTHFISIYVKAKSDNTGLITPRFYSGANWYTLAPLDGGHAYATSQWRRFGVYAEVGTSSSGPNPGFSMVNSNTAITDNDITYWHTPQFETKAYATKPLLSGTRASLLADLSGTGTDGTPSSMTYSAKEQKLHYDNSTNSHVLTDALTFPDKHTVIAWIKPTTALIPVSGDSGNLRTPYFGQNTAAWNPGLWLTSDKIRAHAKYQYTSYTGINWTDTDTWHMVGQIYDGENISLIVDGEIIAGTRVSYSPNTATQIMLGAYATTANSRNFDGYVQNFKVWDEDFSTQQVQNEYLRYRSLYNKPVLEGVYSGRASGPLLYEFNCLTDRSLRGEATTNEFDESVMVNSGYDGPGTVQDTIDAFGTKDNIVRRITGKVRFGNTGGVDVGTLYQYNTYTVSIYLRKTVGSTPDSMEFDICDRTDSKNFTGTLGSNLTTEWKLFTMTAYHDNSVNYHFIDIGTYQGTGEWEWCCAQIEKRSSATPFTKKYRLKWQSTRNLANRSQYGSFHTAGTGDYPTINSSDYNGLVLSSTDASNGNFTTLSKPEIVTSGLVLHLDADDKNSYPGTGATWYDLAKSNDFTIIGSPTHADGAFTINETQGFDRTSIPTNSTTATFVIFYKTTDTQELWATGQTNSYYLAASYGGNYYHSNAGTPTNYVDLTVRTNPTAYRDGAYHMWEAKNVNLSAWTELEFWQYGSSWNMNGTVAYILVYDRALTADESKQNWNALKGRFGY